MRILVGITGGIAAYKSVSLVRLLTEAGHDVQVLPTTNALRFVGAATLEAISHNAIDPDLYSQVDQVKHIKLAQETDLVVIAPATAAFLARYANGLADDLLLNVLLATKARVAIAPAMHTEMWEHPATRVNIATLKARGVEILEPGTGRLTGDDSGVGRMMEPEMIVERVTASNSGSLSGKTVLIAGGGTQEPIDDVRYIGNRSSGRQAIALAEEAQARGAKVILVTSNVLLPVPTNLEHFEVRTSAELDIILHRLLPSADVLLMPVAVSDFSVSAKLSGKIERSSGKGFDLHLEPTKDILAGLSASNNEQGRRSILVGFAAEVSSSLELLRERAKAKLARKGIDLIVANDVSDGKVFGEDSTDVLILSQKFERRVTGSKREVSVEIFDFVEALLNSEDVG